MSQDNYTLTKIADTLEVIADEKTFKLEVVPTQLKFEELSDSCKTTTELLAAVQAWILKEHETPISQTQAYDLLTTVRMAWGAHKKKLADMLTSHFGTGESTPSDSQEKKDLNTSNS